MINHEIKSLSIRLKVARLARGFQNRLAFVQFSGVPLTTYRSHETGSNELKASDVVKYAKLLDISIVWLLTGKGHALDHQAKPDQNKKGLFEYLLKAEQLKQAIRDEEN